MTSTESIFYLKDVMQLISWQLEEIYNSLKRPKTFTQYCIYKEFPKSKVQAFTNQTCLLLNK